MLYVKIENILLLKLVLVILQLRYTQQHKRLTLALSNHTLHL